MYELYQLLNGLFPSGLENLPPELYESIMDQIKDRLPLDLQELSQMEMAEFYDQLKHNFFQWIQPDLPLKFSYNYQSK
jgi:hypothetical protein